MGTELVQQEKLFSVFFFSIRLLPARCSGKSVPLNHASLNQFKRRKNTPTIRVSSIEGYGAVHVAGSVRLPRPVVGLRKVDQANIGS